MRVFAHAEVALAFFLSFVPSLAVTLQGRTQEFVSDTFPHTQISGTRATHPTAGAQVDMIEGLAPFVYQGEAFQTYYKIFGDLSARNATPVVVIHGGPGFTHDYTLPHADLSAHRPVIFYDQIGNGRSTRLPNKSKEFWTVDLFLAEFVNLATHLGIQDAYHIVGHSWGGMMASELVVRRRASGLQRLVVADSPAAVALWRQSFVQLLQTFPKDVQETVMRGEDADPEAYFAAVLKVYAVHGMRVQPFPDDFMTSMRYRYAVDADRTVPKAGILDGWTIIDRLHTVDVPTLTINGAYDIAQDFVMAAYHEKIPGAKWIKFENSSHLPCWEEREQYMQAVETFLAESS